MDIISYLYIIVRYELLSFPLLLHCKHKTQHKNGIATAIAEPIFTQIIGFLILN